MTYFLIYGALFLLPVCGKFFLEPFIPVQPTLYASKEFLAISFILGISITTFLNGPSRSTCKINWCVHALIVSLILSAYQAPPLRLMMGSGDLGGMWIWHGLAWSFAYYFLYLAMIRVPVVREHQKEIIGRCIAWAAAGSACYGLIQYFGLDQFQFVRPYEEIGNGEPSKEITAMIGNPTYLAVWLTMCIPFSWYYLRKPWTFLIVGVILLCRSDIALVGIVFMAIFLACMRARRTIWLKLSGILILLSIVSVIVFWKEIRPLIHDQGRFAVWAQTFDDWKAPAIKIEITDEMSTTQKAEIRKLNSKNYALFGRGIGSFPFFFGQKYSMRYENAHNEHIETPYSIGLIGYALMLGSIGFVLFSCFISARNDIFVLCVYSSFLFSVIASGGLPLWHVEPLRFYCGMMFCLISGFGQRSFKEDSFSFHTHTE